MIRKLERTTFETSREAEYFSADELRKQTTLPPEKFGDVVIKELADNALDAAEEEGVAPRLDMTGTACLEDLLEISVSDNGPGIPPEEVQKIQNFNTRTSDKAAYRSPTGGLRGTR